MRRISFLILLVLAPAFDGSASAQQGSAEQPEQKAVAEPKKGKKKKPRPFQWINRAPKANKALKHRTFHSPSMNIDVGYYILLPPSYQKSEKRRYPVVYYLHGGRPGSEAKSISIGAMAWKLMSADEVSHAIYVFPNGGPVSHYNMPEDPKAQGADVFINELIPHVDSTYRTIAKRSGRALEGFSQGGRATMRLSLRYPELFCSAAAGGGGYATEKRISEEDGFESPTLRFAKGDNTWDLARRYAGGDYPAVRWMVYVGDKGSNYQNNLQYMDFLDQLQIPYRRLIVPGVEHSGKGIYEKEATTIMRFHSKNFVDAATMGTIDAPATPFQQGIQQRR